MPKEKPTPMPVEFSAPVQAEPASISLHKSAPAAKRPPAAHPSEEAWSKLKKAVETKSSDMNIQIRAVEVHRQLDGLKEQSKLGKPLNFRSLQEAWWDLRKWVEAREGTTEVRNLTSEAAPHFESLWKGQS